jgi:uncharacterized FAD-dependent dehydrogenase
VLALGHSSRDTFRMLQRRGVFIEPKPFAIGFRIEHPQSMIDRARLGKLRGPSGARRGRLQARASREQRPRGLQLLHVSRWHRGRGHLRSGRVVTNGMSQYSRNERNANAGIVVGINPETDFPAAAGRRRAAGAARIAGVRTRRRDYCAPAQLVGDFLRGRLRRAGRSRALVQARRALGDLAPALPAYAIEAIREALPVFGRQIRGFDRDDAVLTGVETRTSSPLRITRDPRRCRA